MEFLTPNQWSDDQAGKPDPMPALGGAAAFPLRFLDFLIYQPIRAVLLHGAGVPVLMPSPERYAIHKLIIGSRRKEDRDPTAKSSKDRLQARSIIEAMIANRQHADFASAFTEAWDRGDHWRAAIRQSIATYDDDFQASLQTELSRGLIELGSNPLDYELAEEPPKERTSKSGLK
nr:GSU2403 family nucleotidyltransferase fold protein [Bradyrhizobium hereditatis]